VKDVSDILNRVSSHFFILRLPSCQERRLFDYCQPLVHPAANRGLISSPHVPQSTRDTDGGCVMDYTSHTDCFLFIRELHLLVMGKTMITCLGIFLKRVKNTHTHTETGKSYDSFIYILKKQPLMTQIPPITDSDVWLLDTHYFLRE